MSRPGHVALITGAGRNIGRAIALDLARGGADVVLNVRSNRQELDRVAGEVRELGVRVLPVVADVGQRDEVEGLMRQALAEFGKVDILVNNAAIRPHVSFAAVTWEQWNEVLAIDLHAAFFTTKAALPGMVAQRWGRIINFTGAIAQIGRPNGVHISVAKHGIVGLTKGLAKEYAAHGITVNAVSPGAIDTSRGTPEELAGITARAQGIPAGRLGRPEEIASLCAYLASDGAAYLNGQVIGVNGAEYT